MYTLQNELIHPKAEAKGEVTPTFKQRIAEAGNLLVKNLATGKLKLRDQAKALKQAKRNQKKYNAAARAEYVSNKAKQLERFAETEKQFA